MDWAAIALSLRLATLVSLVLLVVAVPIAYWLTFSSWRGTFLFEAVISLPLVLPPTVLGFYVLVALGARSPIGRAWEAWTGHGLAFTFEALVIASVLYSLPFAVQPTASAFAQIDRNLLEASALLGAGPLRTFWRVVLPLARDGVLQARLDSGLAVGGQAPFAYLLMIERSRLCTFPGRRRRVMVVPPRALPVRPAGVVVVPRNVAMPARRMAGCTSSRRSSIRKPRASAGSGRRPPAAQRPPSAVRRRC